MANTDKDIVITPNRGQAADPTISFVGFDNVACTLTVNPNGTLTVNRQFVSSVATGTAPFAVSSTTRVDNLNADLLDGFNTASASTVNTVVLRDASGDVNVRLVRSEFANQTTISGAMAFRINNTTDNFVRFVSDTPAIRTFLDVPTRTGTNASGTWSINITGNAATATVLQTTRTIWGQNFNGSANVSGALTGVTTISMNSQLTNTVAIGTAPLVVTSTTRVANLNVATAGTADTLTTARTIGGVSFNGSANINLPGVNIAGNQNTSGNAATATLVTGTSGQLQRHDIRTIAPSAITAGRLQFGFTSLANNSSAPYADFLHLRSYTDASGGNDNIVMFNKSAIGMRIYQQAHGSATAYSSFKDIAFTDGTNTSGTWPISITGNAASITNQANSATITASTAATANQIVLRDGSGDDFRRYGFAQYFNMSHGASGSTSDTVFYSSGDDYIRKNNATGFRASLNVPTRTGGDASGTWGINITGNAATATSADLIDGVGFRNTGSNSAVNANTLDSNGIVYYNAGVPNFSGNSTDGALYSQAFSTVWQHQIAGDYRSGQIALRGKNNGTFQAWRTVLDSGNVGTYAVRAQTQGNWLNTGVIANVVGLLAWKNYSNGHVIFDASQGTSPSGTAVNNTNSQVVWTGTYPTLMGWNGTNTYGVRVDSARVADSATDATKLPLSGGSMTGLLIGRPSVGTDVNTMNDAGSFSIRSNSTNAASVSFHRTGAFAINMGVGTDNIFRIGGWSAAANCFQMTSGGALTMLGDVTAFSDLRLKDNIRPISDALTKILNSRGVTFTRTDQPDRERLHIGVVAQEIEKYFPEVVLEDTSGIKSVNYGAMAGAFIEAIKEQQAQIDKLELLVKQLLNTK